MVRNATWKRLDKSAVTRIAKVMFSALGMKITKNKLGQAVPFIGIAIGSGLNASMLAKVSTDADHLYRERFMREKYRMRTPGTGNPRATHSASDAVSVLDIVEAAIVSEDNDQV